MMYLFQHPFDINAPSPIPHDVCQTFLFWGNEEGRGGGDLHAKE